MEMGHSIMSYFIPEPRTEVSDLFAIFKIIDRRLLLLIMVVLVMYIIILAKFKSSTRTCAINNAWTWIEFILQRNKLNFPNSVVIRGAIYVAYFLFYVFYMNSLHINMVVNDAKTPITSVNDLLLEKNKDIQPMWSAYWKSGLQIRARSHPNPAYRKYLQKWVTKQSSFITLLNANLAELEGRGLGGKIALIQEDLNVMLVKQFVCDRIKRWSVEARYNTTGIPWKTHEFDLKLEKWEMKANISLTKRQRIELM